MIMLIGGLILWLRSPHGNEWMRKQLIKQVQKSYPDARIEVDLLYTDLFTEFSLEGVRIYDADNEPMLEMAQISLAYSLSSVFENRVDKLALAVNKPRINVVTFEDGSTNWSRAFPSEEEETEPWEGMTWMLPSLSIDIVDASFHHFSGEEETSVTSIHFSTESNVALGKDIDTTINVISATMSDFGTFESSGNVHWLEDSIGLENFRVKLEPFEVQLHGSLSGFADELTFDLAVNTELKKHSLEALLEQKLPSVNTSVECKINGGLSKVNADLKLSTEAGDALIGLSLEPFISKWKASFSTESLMLDALLPEYVEATKLAGTYELEGNGLSWPDELQAHIEVSGKEQVFWSEPVNDLQVTAELKNGVLEIANVSGKHPIGSVQGKGEIFLLDDKLELEVQAEVESLKDLVFYEVDYLTGSATVQGPLTVGWAEEVVVTQRGQATVTNFTYPYLWIASASGPVVVTYADGDTHVKADLS